MRKVSLKKSVISSALILTVSIAMLIGVTYAVFNDSSSTNVNTIQAGTLDIELVNGSGQSIEGGTVNFVGGSDLRWEPGRSYTLETVYIKNNGDLDLKYKIVVNGIDGTGTLGQYIDWSVQVGGSTVSLADYEETLEVGADSVPITLVGTLRNETPNSVMGETASGISITVYAKQTTEQAAYGD